ncbi:MAG: Uma2 family endonuclease [Myxococcaceae bacterium]
MGDYAYAVQTDLGAEEGRIRRMSLDEWIALDEDESGEWVEGWLVEEEVTYGIHELLVGLLISVLNAWVLPRGGSVFASNLKLALPTQRGRKPDLTVYLPPNRPPLREGALRVPPDIAVEVVSTTARDQRRDRVTKFDEYAFFGVRFYWLLDPQARTLEIFERTPDGRYARALGAATGSVNIPGCDGLVVDLSRLWAQVDERDASA